MQISNYLKMTKQQLQDEINKTESKIRNLKEQVNLLRRLQESAKGDSVESRDFQNGE